MLTLEIIVNKVISADPNEDNLCIYSSLGKESTFYLMSATCPKHHLIKAILMDSHSMNTDSYN